MSIFNIGNVSGASPAIADWSANGAQQMMTLTGNVTGTPTFTDPTSPTTGANLLLIKQDGTGGRTMVWPSSVIWDRGAAPTLSTAAGAEDLVVLVWDGTNYRASFWSGTAGVELTARLTSDIANSTTSFADVTGLSFPVAANINYRFRFFIFYKSAATTTGVQFAVNGPASPTALLVGGVLPQSSAAGGGNTNGGAQSAYDTAVAAASTGPGTTATSGIVEGIFMNGATAGTLTLRLKSEVASSAVTVLTNSFGVLTPF